MKKLWVLVLLLALTGCEKTYDSCVVSKYFVHYETADVVNYTYHNVTITENEGKTTFISDKPLKVFQTDLISYVCYIGDKQKVKEHDLDEGVIVEKTSDEFDVELGHSIQKHTFQLRFNIDHKTRDKFSFEFEDSLITFMFYNEDGNLLYTSNYAPDTHTIDVLGEYSKNFSVNLSEENLYEESYLRLVIIARFTYENEEFVYTDWGHYKFE